MYSDIERWIATELSSIGDGISGIVRIPSTELVKETQRTAHGNWLQIRFRTRVVQSNLWEGWKAAETLDGIVRKPCLLGCGELNDGNGRVWQYLLLEDAPGNVLNSGSFGRADADNLDTDWWTSVESDLAAISEVQTSRISVSRDLLKRRVGFYADTSMQPYATAHADFHWGNLTSTGFILDWDSWGLAPVGFDWATLWAFSLPDPPLALDVERRALNSVGERIFRVSRIFILEEILNTAPRDHRYTELSRHARRYKEGSYTFASRTDSQDREANRGPA